MSNVPNTLSFVRAAAVPIMIYLAWIGLSAHYLILLTFALLTDALDGYVARKYKQVTEFGAKLDSWSDFALYMSVLVCAWLLWPDMIRREAPYMALLFVSYIAPIVFGHAKYGRFTRYHTWATIVSAVLVGCSILLMLKDGSARPFHLFTAMFAIAELEEIIITRKLPEWRTNVPSLWHAMKLSRTLHKQLQ